jgi:hypothetical protein
MAGCTLGDESGLGFWAIAGIVNIMMIQVIIEVSLRTIDEIMKSAPFPKATPVKAALLDD